MLDRDCYSDHLVSVKPVRLPALSLPPPGPNPPMTRVSDPSIALLTSVRKSLVFGSYSSLWVLILRPQVDKLVVEDRSVILIGHY